MSELPLPLLLQDIYIYLRKKRSYVGTNDNDRYACPNCALRGTPDHRPTLIRRVTIERLPAVSASATGSVCLTEYHPGETFRSMRRPPRDY